MCVGGGGGRLQAHFEGVQKIADAVTLPHAVHQLRLRIAEDLDLSDLRARLQQGKSRQHVLTANERMDIWDKLKILSNAISSFYCLYECLICLVVASFIIDLIWDKAENVE